MNGFVLFVLLCFILGNPALRDARIALWKLSVLINVFKPKKKQQKTKPALALCMHAISTVLACVYDQLRMIHTFAMAVGKLNGRQRASAFARSSKVSRLHHT